MVQKRKIDYGWIIVAYGFLTMMLLQYGTVGSQAIFLNPMTETLGVTKTRFTMASTYATVINVIATPWCGKVINRRSLRQMLFIGIVGTSVTMILQSMVTSVYQYYAVIMIRAPFSLLAMMPPFATLTARWFPKETRSFAMGIVFMGISLGGVLLSNPLTSLIDMLGWRMTFGMYGVVCLVVLSPLALLLVKNYPDNYEEMIRDEITAKNPVKIDYISLMKNKRFVLLALGMSCISLVGGSFYHMSTYVQSLGYSAAMGATVISVYNFICMFSKVIMGRIFDKKGMAAGILFGALGLIGAFSCMTVSMFWSSVALLMVVAFFYGIANVCQSMTATAMVSGLFGVKDYSEIYTKLMAITLVFGSICNPLVSLMYESTGSYLLSWVVCLCLSVLSTLFLLMAALDKNKKSLQ